MGYDLPNQQYFMRFGKSSLFSFAIHLETYYLEIYIGTSRADFSVKLSD